MNEQEEQPRFQFVRQLGGGVLGEVHEVVDEATGESVRLKIFLRCRPQNLESFRMEFEALSRLSQPNLAKMIRLIDPASATNIVLEKKVGTPNLAFTQELVPGSPLLDYLAQPEKESERQALSTVNSERTELLTPRTHEFDTLPPTEDSIEIEPLSDELHEVFRKESEDLADASSIIIELAQGKESAPLDIILLRLKNILPGIVAGLEYLHRFQKAHGNLRPSNIIVSNLGNVKLTDYGIVASLVVNHENENQTPLLQAPEYLPFAAPEMTGNEVSPSSDLYALGCILFEAISGVSPFDALEFDLVDGERRLQPPPLSDYVSACPSNWGELVDGLLKGNPEERIKLDGILPLISGSETYSVHIQTDRVEKVIGFKGRKAELSSIIHDAKSATESNQQRLTIVSGMTGSGKSALLQQSAHYLSRRGWLVLKSSCLHSEIEIHQSWKEIAKTLAKVLDSFPEDIQEQFQLARQKATRLLVDLRGADDKSDDLDRNDCVLAFHEILKIVSREKPILLIFDDVENASWDTNALLVDLLCIPESFRALVLLSYNPDPQESPPRLMGDLSRTLIDYRNLQLDPMERQSDAKYIALLPVNLRTYDLPLISMWWSAFPQAIEDAMRHRDLIDCRSLSVLCSKAVYKELRSVEKLVACLVCIASRPLSKTLVLKIVSAYNKKYKAFQIEEAIEALLDLEFLREHNNDVELAHDSIRTAILGDSDEELIRSLFEKLSKALRSNPELSIEYAHRSGDNRNAISESIAQAENASRSFALNRSAAIWKWIDLHKEMMPGTRKENYIEERACAEFLAQEYPMAAELFQKAVKNNPQHSKAMMKISQSLLWSNELRGASEELKSSIAKQGGKLARKNPFTLFVRDKKLGSEASSAKPSDLSISYHFGAKYAFFLPDISIDGAAARLRSMAKNEGKSTWLLSQSAKVRVAYARILTTPPEQFSSWSKEYRDNFDNNDENFFFFQKLRLRFGKHDNSFLMTIFDQMDPRAKVDELVDALDFCRESLLFGGRERATKFALDVIRANHRNLFLSSVAYQILIRDAIYRDDLEGASLYFELAGFEANFDQMSDFDVLNFVCESDLSILQGECEVALARYNLLTHSPAFQNLSHRAKANLRLGYFRSIAAQYRRDRLLSSRRKNETLQVMGKICGYLRKVATSADPFLAAEALRALALFARFNGKKRKAERLIRQSIERIDGRLCPLVNAQSLEALSLSDNENEDKRGMFDSAVLLQTNFGYPQLLRQEGWPTFEESLKQ